MSSPPLGFSPWRRSVSNDRTSNRAVSSPTRVPGAAAATASGGLSDPRLLSTSVASGATAAHKEPIRSFIHSSDRELGAHVPARPQPCPAAAVSPSLIHILTDAILPVSPRPSPPRRRSSHIAPIVDGAQYARSVREDTADLASYWLSPDRNEGGAVGAATAAAAGVATTNPLFLRRTRSYSSQMSRDGSMSRMASPLADQAGRDSIDSMFDPPTPAGPAASRVIVELPEPESPEERDEPPLASTSAAKRRTADDQDAAGADQDNPSLLSSMLRRSPPRSWHPPGPEPSPSATAGAGGASQAPPHEQKRGRSPTARKEKDRGGSGGRTAESPAQQAEDRGEEGSGGRRGDHDERTPLIRRPVDLDPEEHSLSFHPFPNDEGRAGSDANGSPNGLYGFEPTHGYGTNGSARSQRGGRHLDHHHHQQPGAGAGAHYDVEGQVKKYQNAGAGAASAYDPRPWCRRVAAKGTDAWDSAVGAARLAADPKRWDRRALWQNAVVAPVACVPAVVVGLLLNILDALSYGMILFPLGIPLFSNLGSAGISVFYVSTIISQLIFTAGSIFKGGVGSELIEVVPFFHSMAQTIIDTLGDDDADAVIATTIVAYSLSSVVTGLVFYLMGKFKFGYIVGFIPRHILIGCIGGVGWFLLATGFQVSARLEGSFNYDLDTAKRLVQPDTMLLWIFPLVLAIVLFVCQQKIVSKYFLPIYIICIPLIFYFFVFALDALDVDTLRNHGWIFEAPPAGEPWWYFYTLYKFDKVSWEAVFNTVPAMCALTFFGILHVPINVPALAMNVGEDNANLDRELKLHGYSNIISGLFGSIQNYLVYANTVVFMRAGGNTRLAGFMLAAATFGIMIVGPSIIGTIPVMMVGTIIFTLGFELVVESVWEPRKKLKWLEYLTVITIVLIMGIYDFVAGIFVGIALALVSLVFQASRVPAVRACYTGDIVGSTVRRNPSQHHYLQQVGRQTSIMKLSGFLFFGTVVGIENNIRSLIDEETFAEHPIQFVVMDMFHVTGIDYSAGEAFMTISRLLNKKGIELVISGVEGESELGRTLRTIGLGLAGFEVPLLPDLNSALESCENELLKTFYNQEALKQQQQQLLQQQQQQLSPQPRGGPSASATRLAVPIANAEPANKNGSSSSSRSGGGRGLHDMSVGSPRRSQLHEAAAQVSELETSRNTRWKHLSEPLRLMLQIFADLSGRSSEDFWWAATKYFARAEYAAGTTLFRRGDDADAFYLLERGILRCEYDLPQGCLYESIVAGTTCGELPFFSETTRTATVVAERDCVVWRMDRASWERLEAENPPVAQELLRISLKLTSERMGVITNYILTTAS